MRLLESTSEIATDPTRKEILRAWIDGGMLSIVRASDVDSKFEDSAENWWAMILSDIVHHVIDAIAIEAELPKEKIRNKFQYHLSEVIRSDRGTRKGKILAEAGKKDLPIDYESEDTVEMVRVIRSSESIHVLVYVGMWLKTGDEEATWSNIIYDIAAMISESVASFDEYDTFRSSVLEQLLEYVENPTTESYSGQYRNDTEPSASDNEGKPRV